MSDTEIPRPAIRPYPSQYTTAWTAEERYQALAPAHPSRGRALAGDVPRHALRAFRLAAILPCDRAQRRVAHERLTRICFIDYDREMALVASRQDPTTDDPEILGVGRLSKIRETNEAEFALLIADKFQRQGLGTALLDRLLQVGRDEKIARITGDILPENFEMQRLCEKLGFRLTRPPDEPVVKAMIDL